MPGRFDRTVLVRSFVLSAAALACAPALAADSPAWKFTPGEVFYYSRGVMFFAEPDSKEEPRMQMDLRDDARVEVVKQVDGVTTVRLVLLRRLEKEMAGDNVIRMTNTLDANDPKHIPADDPVAMEIELDARGRAVKVTKLPRKSPAAAVERIERNGLHTAERFNQLLMGGWISLPDERLEPGSDWQLSNAGAAEQPLMALVPKYDIRYAGATKGPLGELPTFIVTLPGGDKGEVEFAPGAPKLRFERLEQRGQVLFDAEWGKMRELEFVLTIKLFKPEKAAGAESAVLSMNVWNRFSKEAIKLDELPPEFVPAKADEKPAEETPADGDGG